MDEKMSVTESLAKFIKTQTFDGLPGPVVDKAKTCVFHALACSLNGHHLPWSQAAINYLKDLNVKGDGTTILDGLKAPPPDAAFVNSVLGCSTVGEDQHLPSASHPGSMVIPAALAVGEQSNCTGKEFLAAVVIGYEVLTRIGMSVMSLEFNNKYRPSSVFGPYGTCATSSRLFGLDEQQTVNSLGMAGSRSMGFQECFTEGTDEFYFQNGFATSSGIRAAMLGRKGINASKRIVEGPAGYWAAYQRQPAADNITTGLGQSFEILKIYYKPVPACALVQTAVALAHRMTKDRAINPEDIGKIEIGTFQAAKNYPGLDNTGPFKSMTTAKLSLQYGVAAAVASKELNQSIYDRFEDPLVNKIASNSSVKVDDEIEKQFSQTFQQGCRINITMRDKSVISDTQKDVVPLSDTQVEDNFRTLTRRLIGDKQAEEMVEKIKNLEKVENIRELTKLLVKK
ncbi:MAG: MmgE/PrpD family protein [Dehalococcoidia bacterium]|nr:MmgE/PrpD family protein [Dehalococcoidia bacterium]